MNDDNEIESKYYTIIELLETMPFKKILLILFGFYLFVYTVVMALVYWYLHHYHK